MRAPFTVTGPAGPARGVARVDTGADRCVLDPAVAQAAGAVPVGYAVEVGVDGAPIPAALYTLDLDMGPLGSLPAVTWAALPLRAAGLDVDALIGVNVLERSELSYDGRGGWWTLSIGTATTPATTSAPSRPELIAAGVTVLGVLGLFIGLAVTPRPA